VKKCDDHVAGVMARKTHQQHPHGGNQKKSNSFPRATWKEELLDASWKASNWVISAENLVRGADIQDDQGTGTAVKDMPPAPFDRSMRNRLDALFKRLFDDVSRRRPKLNAISV
jgi:hypothetical protein